MKRRNAREKLKHAKSCIKDNDHEWNLTTFFMLLLLPPGTSVLTFVFVTRKKKTKTKDFCSSIYRNGKHENFLYTTLFATKFDFT